MTKFQLSNFFRGSPLRCPISARGHFSTAVYITFWSLFLKYFPPLNYPTINLDNPVCIFFCYFRMEGLIS